MRTFIASLLAFVLVVPGFVFAEEVVTTTAQVKPPCPALVQGFVRGAQGSGVKDLQLFLSAHFGVASSTIATGFFGPKTQELIMKLQGQHGLEQVGSVGPKTRAAILALCGKGGGQSDPGSIPGNPGAFDRVPIPKDAPRQGVSCNIRVSPNMITANQPVTFSWTSVGADYSVWGSGDKDNANESSRVFTNISSTTTFSLTFFGQNGSATCRITVFVNGTENSDQKPIRPPITGGVCPAIGWVQPTSPCDGAWTPRYNDGGCQIGWQCIGGTTTPPKDQSLCPQVLPACANPMVTIGADGCKILRCPVASSTPPIVKPPIACPLIAYIPIQCDGTLVEKKDANGCQIGWTCNSAASTGGSGASCTTPWGAKVLSDGLTVPYEPYFSQGRLSKSVVIPLMKCTAGVWQLCDWQGNNCRAWKPLELQLNNYAPTSAYSATELAAAFSALQNLVQGIQSIFGQ